MPYNIDSLLSNADWSKRTWDLPIQNAQDLTAWLARHNMTFAQFQHLPVYTLNVGAMPWLQHYEQTLGAKAHAPAVVKATAPKTLNANSKLAKRGAAIDLQPTIDKGSAAVRDVFAAVIQRAAKKVKPAAKAAAGVAGATGLSADELTYLTNLYHFGDLDYEGLQEAIYEAQLEAYTTAFQAHVKATGAKLPNNWAPASAVTDAMQQYAEREADDIVTTWTDSLTRLVSEQEGASEMDDIDVMQAELQDYADNYADYKSEQIAKTEAVKGADRSVNDFTDAVQSGVVQMAEAAQAALICAILPTTAGDSLCGEWAGAYVPLSEADSLPDMPLHPNCGHVKHIELDTSIDEEF